MSRDEFHFTPTEHKVMHGILRGEGPSHLARTLEITERELKTHVRHILIKTDSRTRVELISKMERRLLS